MAKILIKKLDQNASLYRDPKNGVAWVEDGNTGLGYPCHANIDETGSVDSMKARGYWGKADRTVRSHGFIYNLIISFAPFDFVNPYPCGFQTFFYLD